MKHFITKYKNEENQLVVVSWLQINIFNKCFCFSKKEITINEEETILNDDLYSKMVVKSNEGKKVAEVTLSEATPAEGYQIILTPKYD